eukprot:6464525-Amphidinium_carterae.2
MAIEGIVLAIKGLEMVPPVFLPHVVDLVHIGCNAAVCSLEPGGRWGSVRSCDCTYGSVSLPGAATADALMNLGALTFYP